MNCRSVLGLTVVAVISFSAGGIARADEVVKFRMVTHATLAQTQDVDDVDGHILVLGHLVGLAFFPDGSIGPAALSFTSDYIKGVGTFSSYFSVGFKDGSALWWKGNGQGRPGEGTTTIFPEFPISVIRGTGRFEGATGDGTQTAVRVVPIAVGAHLVADVVLNVKK
jgi:hypothetical protein